MPELKGPVWELGIPVIGKAAFDGGEMNGPFVVIGKK